MNFPVLRALLFLLVCLNVLYSHGQIVYRPLQYDVSRKDYTRNNTNARLAESYVDTLSLPFFEDFTSPNPSIDSIYFEGNQIRVTTLGHHGLRNGEVIFLKMQEPEASYLNKLHYAKVDSKSSFILFSDASLQSNFAPGALPNARWHGYWRRPGAKLSANPDSTKWVTGGGTYINNTFGINPPSNYVASFDGLTSNGQPYSYTDVNGPTDHLTSLPIDLSNLNGNSEVVLSFYWQAGGNGFFPDPKDSLYLTFLDAKGNWHRQWGKKGGSFLIDSAAFYYEEIPVKEDIYLHNAFQFRFQSVGNKSGNNDNWNIDYIYLDKNWGTEKRNPKDRTISRSQHSILKGYNALPADHFRLNPGAHLKDSVSFELKSLSDTRAFLDFRNNYVTDGQTKIPFQVNVTTAILNPKDTIQYQWNVKKDELPLEGVPLRIKYIVEAYASDPDKLNGVDFTTNNTDSSEVVLDDYYAHDDGSAEQMGGSPLGGTLIFEFDNYHPGDTITHIDVFTPQTSNTLTEVRKTIRLRIYDKDKKPIGGELSRQVDYTLGLNGFNRFAIDTVRGGFVLDSDIFYVGFVSPTPSAGGQSNYFPIGVDVNTNTNQKIFYRLYATQEWKELKGLGTFMIRPVFKNNVVTGLFDKVDNSLICTVYPVPSKGAISISGEVNEVKIYDIAGNRHLNASFINAEHFLQLDLAYLPQGMYFLHLTNAKGMSTVKKISLLK